MTDQHKNFTKWALFGHALQDSDHGGYPTSIWTNHHKMEAAQYLWTLLTDQHKNFTKWVLFGHTLQNFNQRDHLTSIWPYHYKMEAAQYLWILSTDQHQNFTKWALFTHNFSVAKATLESQVTVCLCRKPSAFQNCSYQPWSLSTIEPINPSLVGGGRKVVAPSFTSSSAVNFDFHDPKPV